MMLEWLLFVVGLICHDDAILGVLPSSDVAIASGNEEQFILLVGEVENV